MIEIKEKLKESKRFWSNLPDDICAKGKLTEFDEEQCWNSHTKGRWGLLRLFITREKSPCSPVISFCLPGIKITTLCSQINALFVSTMVSAYMENFYISSEALILWGLRSFQHLLSPLRCAATKLYSRLDSELFSLTVNQRHWQRKYITPSLWLSPSNKITRWCNKRHVNYLVCASILFKHHSKSGR